MASIQGWGRETWNSGAWSQQAPVSVTGIGLTSSAGTETVTTDQNISVSGNPLTSSVGDESTSVTKTTGWNRDTDINTGGSIGWSEQQWGAVGGSFALTGQPMTISTGDEAVATDQNISVSGNPLTSTTGTFAISGDPFKAISLILIISRLSAVENNISLLLSKIIYDNLTLS